MEGRGWEEDLGGSAAPSPHSRRPYFNEYVPKAVFHISCFIDAERPHT